jgi:hypothetical protein
MPSACVSASPTPNVPNRKSLNFQERRPAVENVEAEKVEKVENAEAFIGQGYEQEDTSYVKLTGSHKSGCNC